MGSLSRSDHVGLRRVMVESLRRSYNTSRSILLKTDPPSPLRAGTVISFSALSDSSIPFLNPLPRLSHFSWKRRTVVSLSLCSLCLFLLLDITVPSEGRV